MLDRAATDNRQTGDIYSNNQFDIEEIMYRPETVYQRLPFMNIQRHRLFDNTLPKYYTHHYLNHWVVLDVLR